MSGVTEVADLHFDFDFNDHLDPLDPWSVDTFLSNGLRLFQCILLVIGIILAWFGNGAAMYAVQQTRRHDPVLGAFILNLLVNDLLLSLFDLPLSFITLAVGRWPLGDAMCKITACLCRMLKLALPWSVCCLAIDKHCAVVHAMHYRHLLTSFRCYLLVSAVWIIACLQAILPLIGFGDYRFIPSAYQCGIAWNANYYYATMSCVIGIILPMVITIYCYTCVLRTSMSHGRRVDAPVQLSRISRVMGMRGSTDHRIGSAVSRNASLPRFDGKTPCHVYSQQPQPDRPHSNSYNPKKAIKHVLGICGVFLCCWIPYTTIHISLMIQDAVNKISYYHGISHYITLAIYFIHINVILNPFMYILFNHRMKRALKKSIRKLWRKERPQRRSTVFVTNYSRVGHRAAMRHHRARYAGLLPVFDQYHRGLQVRGSDSTSSTLSESHLLKVREVRRRQSQDRTMIGLDGFPHYRMGHRLSSALSDYSAATFPDTCVPGAIPSDDNGDQISNAFQVAEDTQVHRAANDIPFERYQAHTSLTCLHTGSLEDDHMFADKDGAILNGDTQRYKSILVPHSYPMQRRALKKQRTVIFSDYVPSSPSVKGYTEKVKVRKVKSSPADVIKSVMPKSPSHWGPKKPKSRHHKTIQIQYLGNKRKALLSSSSSEEDVNVISKQTSLSRRVQKQRWRQAKRLVTADANMLSPILKSPRTDSFKSFVPPSRHHSSSRSSCTPSNTRLNHSMKCRKTIRKKSNATIYYPDFKDNVSLEEDCFTYDGPTRRLETTDIGQDIHTPYYRQISPGEFGSGELIRDEGYFVDEIWSAERSSVQKVEGCISPKSLPQALTLNPMSLIKVALGPIKPKRRGVSSSCSAYKDASLFPPYENPRDSSSSESEQMYVPPFPDVFLDESVDLSIRSQRQLARKRKLRSYQESKPKIRVRPSRVSEPNQLILQRELRRPSLPLGQLLDASKDNYEESVL